MVFRLYAHAYDMLTFIVLSAVQNNMIAITSFEISLTYSRKIYIRLRRSLRRIQEF